MCAIYSVRPPSVLPANPPEPTLGRPTEASTQNANRSRFLSSVNTLCDNNAANGLRQYATAHSAQTTSYPTRWLVWMPSQAKLDEAGSRLDLPKRRCWSYKRKGLRGLPQQRSWTRPVEQKSSFHRLRICLFKNYSGVSTPKSRHNWLLWRLTPLMAIALAISLPAGLAASCSLTFCDLCCGEKETVRWREYPNEAVRGRCGMPYCLCIKTSYLGWVS